LSILQARIDTIPDKAIAKELSRDIARMKRIVSQLLDMAELEAFSVGWTDTADLKAVCVDVAEFVAPLAVAEGKQILLEAPEAPVPVNGNAEVLFRAVRNIAENAIRHTPKGGTVTIAVRPEGAVSVADEGPGIPHSEREQIFQRFWRKDRRGSSGAGLGLSIVRRIMDAHRGEINISNKSAVGCVFTLKLRPKRATPPRGAMRNEKAGAPLPAAAKEDCGLSQGGKA
jgi:signal transduction histidine kinase